MKQTFRRAALIKNSMIQCQLDFVVLGQLPEGHFPKPTFRRWTVPRITFPRTEISPNVHFPESHFFYLFN